MPLRPRWTAPQHAALAAATVLVACVGRAGPAARAPGSEPARDGTVAAPFEAAEVEDGPRLIGCEQGLAAARDYPQAQGAFPLTLVVDAEGRVVPGSVNQRRPGGYNLRRAFGPAAAEQDVLTCRYQPAARAGQPVAVRVLAYFVYP